MKRILLASFILLSLNSNAQNRLSEQVGNIKKAVAISGGYEFELVNASARITAYNANTLRVRISKQKFMDDFSFAVDELSARGKIINTNNSGSKHFYATDSLRIVVEGEPFRISIYNNKNELLNADENALGVSWFGNQVSCYKQLNKDEKFIGLERRQEA